MSEWNMYRIISRPCGCHRYDCAECSIYDEYMDSLYAAEQPTDDPLEET